MRSGIENPSKLEVIGRCGGDEKTDAEPTKVWISPSYTWNVLY